MSAFRLVVLDVDGTLVERGQPVSPRVRRAIARAQEQGTIVTLASGRMFPLVEPFARELALRDPVICYGGALIVEPATGRPLFRRGVPLSLAREVIEEARARGLTARAYLDHKVYVDRLDPEAFNYESLRRVGARPVGDLVSFLTDDPSHLAIDAPADQTRPLVDDLRRRFGSRLNVTTGHPHLAEFSHLEVHKGSALAWLGRHLGIDLGETLAIGDDWNDIEMLRAAGLGVAVANAHPRVLAVARAIVPAVAEDGVAVALERFVLDSQKGGRD